MQCSTILAQYLLSLFCFSVASCLLACPPVRPSSEAAVLNVFMLKVLYYSLFLFLKIPDLFFANPKTSM